MSNKNNDPNSFSSYSIIDGTEKNKEEKAEVFIEPEKKEETEPTPVKDTYQAQPPPNVFQPQSTVGIERKTGRISSVVFWILFVVIGGFALLLDLSAKSYIGAGISILILAGMFFWKGRLTKKPVLHIGAWIGATLLLFIVFGVTIPKTGDAGGLTTNTNTMIQSGGVEVERVGFAMEVDPNTLKPISVTSTFRPDTAIIYYSVFLKVLPAGTELKATLNFNDQVVLEIGPSTFPEEIRERYYTINVPKNEGQDITEGKYTMRLTGTNNGKEVLKMSDTFTVAK